MREVTKVYVMGEVEVHALQSVNLELCEEEFVVLLGPSGSGKSTLLNILGGLDIPSRGQVLFRHWELTTADNAALTRFRRQYVGLVLQFYNLHSQFDGTGERGAGDRDCQRADDA
jgi:putative ABC transport system ATP-binding protein